MYNHSYGGERYTVGILMCDVNFSGSWGKGEDSRLLRQPIRGRKQGETGREREPT